VKRIEADLALRPDIRVQAWGESQAPQRVEQLMQLDERLTRQYETLLGMLERARRCSGLKQDKSATRAIR
jgi:hypothetical protein